MPEQSFSSSPSWDPSSQTPIRDLEDDLDIGHNPQSTLAGSSHGPVPQDQVAIQYNLLDPRLLNARLKVIVNGGTFDGKGVVATIESVKGRLSIRYESYKKPTTLNPEWVTPEYPNSTRSNGLLVVIKGDHCGKYVRWIHHRYEGGGEVAILNLAVVKRAVGSAESLTGEQLELDKFHLCVCDESKEDRRLGSSLVDGLRLEARKTRAK